MHWTFSSLYISSLLCCNSGELFVLFISSQLLVPWSLCQLVSNSPTGAEVNLLGELEITTENCRLAEACKIIFTTHILLCHYLAGAETSQKPCHGPSTVTCEMWCLPTNPSLLRKDRRNRRRMLCVIRHLPKSMGEVRQNFRTLNAPGVQYLEKQGVFSWKWFTWE
jgi:hypothetical protein